MHRLTITATAVCVSLLLTSCEDTAPPTAPQLAAARAVGGGDQRLVQMLDACDPESFNAALGAGTCTRRGGVLFDRFLDLLGQHQSVGAWHFAPGTLHARVGQTLVAVNHGGEEHTFTEVEEFGGGIVPELNELSGNPTPAPECLALAPGDFVPPGGSYTDDVEEPGAEQYQCCIHPWMRATVDARP
jgi:plastocyanin